MRGVGVVVVLLRGKDRMEMSDEEGECVDVRAMEKDGNRGNRMAEWTKSGGFGPSARGTLTTCSKAHVRVGNVWGKKQEVGKDGNEVFQGNAKHLHEIERVWWEEGWLLRARERARTGVKIERVGMEQRRAEHENTRTELRGSSHGIEEERREMILKKSRKDDARQIHKSGAFDFKGKHEEENEGIDNVIENASPKPFYTVQPVPRLNELKRDQVES
ncbi:hypothetical protein EDB84DRAFT_1441943 [Lactarius hengduanensis]|nr:hypothetical protein EDB84DRAFT_1441943 [Lactarius hengduanensis]